MKLAAAALLAVSLGSAASAAPITFICKGVQTGSLTQHASTHPETRTSPSSLPMQIVVDGETWCIAETNPHTNQMSECMPSENPLFSYSDGTYVLTNSNITGNLDHFVIRKDGAWKWDMDVYDLQHDTRGVMHGSGTCMKFWR